MRRETLPDGSVHIDAAHEVHLATMARPKYAGGGMSMTVPGAVVKLARLHAEGKISVRDVNRRLRTAGLGGTIEKRAPSRRNEAEARRSAIAGAQARLKRFHASE